MYFGINFPQESGGVPLPDLSPPPKKKVKVINSSKERDHQKKDKTKDRKKIENEEVVEIDGTREVHITLSPRTPVVDPPEPEELIKALLVSNCK